MQRISIFLLLHYTGRKLSGYTFVKDFRGEGDLPLGILLPLPHHTRNGGLVGFLSMSWADGRKPASWACGVPLLPPFLADFLSQNSRDQTTGGGGGIFWCCVLNLLTYCRSVLLEAVHLKALSFYSQVGQILCTSDSGSRPLQFDVNLRSKNVETSNLEIYA